MRRRDECDRDLVAQHGEGNDGEEAFSGVGGHVCIAEGAADPTGAVHADTSDPASVRRVRIERTFCDDGRESDTAGNDADDGAVRADDTDQFISLSRVRELRARRHDGYRRRRDDTV